jgi:hypothetical protein
MQWRGAWSCRGSTGARKKKRWRRRSNRSSKN